MEWIAQNWVWVLFAVGMVAMHMFGHGGHGGHGGHRGGHDDAKRTRNDNARPPSEQGPGHRH